MTLKLVTIQDEPLPETRLEWIKQHSKLERARERQNKKVLKMIDTLQAEHAVLYAMDQRLDVLRAMPKYDDEE